MSSVEAGGFHQDPAQAGRVAPFRVSPWIVDCVVACPIASAMLLILGGYAWEPLVSASAALTVAIFAGFEGIRTSPGYVAEAICLAFAASLAALGPSIAMGASEWGSNDKAASAAALFPVWLAVMLAPAGVIYEFSGALDDSLHRAHLAYNFLVVFSAAATSIALAYMIWVRHHPDGFIRNRVLPKRKTRFATGSGASSRFGNGADLLDAASC